VHQVIDWTGGTGTKPATGLYVGASGLTAVLADAIDIRGAAGATGATGSTGSAGAAGSNGTNGWSPVFAVVTDGSRRVLQVSDWTGGTGSKPEAGLYVGVSGLTAVLADAIDVRGATGATGATGNSTTWLNGTGNPHPALGAVGDYYVDYNTHDVHEKTGASTWTYRMNILGATGPSGATGPPAGLNYIRGGNSNPPGSGRLKVNTSTETAITELQVYDMDMGDENNGAFLESVRPGSTIVLTGEGLSGVLLTVASVSRSSQISTFVISSSTGSLMAVGATAGLIVCPPGTDGLDSTGGCDIQLLTTSGTWTKPAGATYCDITLQGGGGGGGSGRRGATSTNRMGGGGGAPGSRRMVRVPASIFDATEAYTIGAGGPGGAAISTDSTNGATGTAGGLTRFDDFGTSLFANGGAAGAGGTAANGNPGSGAVNGFSNLLMGLLANAPNGGTGSTTAPTVGVAPTVIMPTGGGGGGGISSANALGTGAAGGGLTLDGGTFFAGGAGGAPATAGSAGGSLANYLLGTGGGGGGTGGNNGLTNGGTGGEGGGYGSGGGGGGAASQSAASSSGKGGDGAPGFILVITYLG
jgi:hypothetical protein